MFSVSKMQIVPGRILLWTLGRAYVSTSNAVRFTTRLYSSFWSDTLTFPVYAAALSVLVLVLQTTLYFTWTRQGRSETAYTTIGGPTVRGTLFARFGKHVQTLGGWLIFVCRITRFVALGVLLGLSAHTLTRALKYSGGYHGIDDPKWRYLGLVIVYVSFYSAAVRATCTDLGAVILYHSCASFYCSQAPSLQSRRQTPKPCLNRRMGCLCLPRYLASLDVYTQTSRRPRRMADLDEDWFPDIRGSSCAFDDSARIHSRRSISASIYSEGLWDHLTVICRTPQRRLMSNRQLLFCQWHCISS
jgi:hypothetical protein